MDLNNDGDTTDDGEPRIINTAKEIDGLEIDGVVVFQGYDIWEDDGTAVTNAGDLHTGDGARVIAFTNKTQDDPPVEAANAVVAVSFDNAELPSGAVVDDLGTKVGNSYTGVKLDHDGADTTPVIEGTLICHMPAECSVTQSGDTITVTGYRFTGSTEAKDAVTAMTAEQQAAANNDYLVFGLWLDESNDGATDTFGAFAVGGAGYAVNVQNAVTDTATYTGLAVGAHHKTGEGVNWFHGDASLTADFGTDALPGTVSGEISNIQVNGGEAMSTPINLGQAALSDGSAVFNGAAFMGAATAPGASTHEFDGTWSGSFYGGTADDTDTTENESITFPMAAAGTFGVTKSVTTGTGDDAMTTVESYVGAFGAHLDE